MQVYPLKRFKELRDSQNPKLIIKRSWMLNVLYFFYCFILWHSSSTVLSWKNACIPIRCQSLTYISLLGVNTYFNFHNFNSWKQRNLYRDLTITHNNANIISQTLMCQSVVDTFMLWSLKPYINYRSSDQWWVAKVMFEVFIKLIEKPCMRQVHCHYLSKSINHIDHLQCSIKPEWVWSLEFFYYLHSAFPFVHSWRSLKQMMDKMTGDMKFRWRVSW